jgi:class 3 adenylate cyclase/tetratricopeptide (TPR) repeat protein
MIDQERASFDRFLAERGENLGSEIHKLWESRDKVVWAREPYFYLRLGELADRVGQSMFAHDILQEGLEHFSGDLRLTQLYCLSLVKCGFLRTARDILTRLVREGHEDEETLGILGRVYKEMWLIASDGDRSSPYLRQSRNLYLKAFQGSHGNYSGINAASLSLIMGDRETAQRLSRRVIKICADRVRQPAGRDYWVVATLGEAFLLQGRQEEALKYYRLARRLSSNNFATLASTRRQLNLLGGYTDIDEEVLAALRVPPVVAFTGHMLDAPGRKGPRFPEERAESVRRAIDSVLRQLDAAIGYSSAACGADVLFLEAMQSRGAETNVILPFDREEFFAASVNFAGESWVRRTTAALDRARKTEQASRGGYGGEDLLFSFANRLILGKAIQRSRFLETEAHLLAVWDGIRNGAPGGTSEFVETWEKMGAPHTLINVKTLEVRTSEVQQRAGGRPVRGVGPRRRVAGARRTPRRRASRRVRLKAGEVVRDVVAILFADLVGYSRLTEDQMPHYIRGFLGTVAHRLGELGREPLFKNIWGDALFFVYRDLVDAALSALVLRDMLRETDWASLGLPGDLNIRIGLHAGPVYYGVEPLLGRVNFFGSHVNQAARIEPITSPGNVYASEQFAALLLAEPNHGLDCRYVGVIVLPKEFGSYPIYHVSRKSEIG